MRPLSFVVMWLYSQWTCVRVNRGENRDRGTGELVAGRWVCAHVLPGGFLVVCIAYVSTRSRKGAAGVVKYMQQQVSEAPLWDPIH